MSLAGKRLLVTGVLTESSIACAVARRAQREGAEVVLTSFGRVRSITERVARRLPDPQVRIVTLDAANDADFAALAHEVGGTLDGVLHAIAYAPESCLGDGLDRASWDDVATTLRVSTYSFAALAYALRPIMERGSAVLGLDFDNSRVAWPAYGWMGVAKAALESTCRYVARDLGPAGITVNLIAAGPLRTTAAKSIPGFAGFDEQWDARAPLGWDTRDADAVARACVAIFAGHFPATTGEIIHVDGGAHAAG